MKRARRARGLLPLPFLLPGCLLPFQGVVGQVRPDTLPPVSDTLPPVSDTLPPVPDSLAPGVLDPDSLEAGPPGADSVAPGDTLPALVLPEHPTALPRGFETGVWSWDREELLGIRATTLAELVAEIPGAVPLRGGDHGTPVTVSVFGAGGDRIRVFRDGMELLPLEGSTPDLGRIALGGLRSVRMVRSAGGLRIELKSLVAEGGRPYSFIEAGTGDLNTNVFRGTFSHPDVFGGVLALTMDRVDSQGPFGQEPGSSAGGWIRFGRPLGSRGSLLLDFSTRTMDRGDLFSPATSSRKDLSLLTRWRLPFGLLGDLFYSTSTLDTDEGEFDFIPGTRSQMGGTLSYESPRVRALGRYREASGEGVPVRSAFFEGAAGLEKVGWIAGEAEWADWGGKTTTSTRLRAWSTPWYGFTLFGEVGSGSSGLPYLEELSPLVPYSEEADTVPPSISGPRASDHDEARFGVSYRRGSVYLSGARVEVSADSLFLTGLAPDRSGITVDETFLPSATLPGGTRSGFELSGRLPLYPRGFALEGWYQWWDQEEDVLASPQDSLSAPEPLPQEKIPWRYLPRRNYQAAITFHDTFMPTGNLEVWFDLGVAGRDPMATPFLQAYEVAAEPPDEGDGEGAEPLTRYLPTMVPFYQSWFVRIQIRVVTVRAFFMWENFTQRQRNQDFPGRVLIPSRSLYGVRWTMWN